MNREKGAGKVEDVEEVPLGLEEGPGMLDGDGFWRPIRVAFTTWKVGFRMAKKWSATFPDTMEPSWTDFAGYVHDPPYKSEFNGSFLGQCHTLKDNRGKWEGKFGRFLHREEMNLKPAGEYLEMYDRLVGREWKEYPKKMDFLNKHDPLPLVHIVVNRSDNRGSYDLFFPHKRHFDDHDSIDYMNEDKFSGMHQQKREYSAEQAGACPHCAIEMDEDDSEFRITKGTVYHIRSGYSSTFPTDDIYGYREYGEEITEENAMENRPGGIIVHLPKGNQVKKIFLPRDVVHKVSGPGARWSKMKIFPDSDLPSN